jgi:hypothetical protein
VRDRENDFSVLKNVINYTVLAKKDGKTRRKISLLQKN